MTKTRARAVMVLCSSMLAACGGDSAASREVPKGADIVGTSTWCVQHGCAPSAPIAMDSGKTNHPFMLPPAEYAMVEAQTRDSALIGAGLMLWNERHASGPTTEESLASFATSIVGECPAATRHIKANYTATVSAVMSAPAVACDAWSVRAGHHDRGFFVSVDRVK